MTQTVAARPLLLPLVPVYRLALALREMRLRSGLEPIRRLRWPVVSIGNISTGGSGKTPLTIALARALTARGLHVDVLSRGYGRWRSALPLLVDCDGTAEEFGDEPLLIARESRVPVYVATERYEAGLLAESERSAPSTFGVHLLDDGFQHRQLARDVDILLLSRADLTGHLLPAGNLREPIHAARRAGVIAIPADESDLEIHLKSSGWQGTVWLLRRRMELPPIDDSAGGPVVAFCGIARPAQFFQGLEALGLRLAARIAFSDHHRYTARDLASLAARARKATAKTLVTTEKDRVRIGSLAAALPDSLPLKTAQLRIEIENQDAAVDWLIHRLSGHQSIIS
jgi:tetraacyldisaccharide 4'-kinase